MARTTLCCVPLSGLRGRAGSTGLTKCTADPFRNTCSHVPREVLVLVQVRVHVLVVEAAVPRAPIAAVEASRRAPDVIEAAGVADVPEMPARFHACGSALFEAKKTSRHDFQCCHERGGGNAQRFELQVSFCGCRSSEMSNMENGT